jgi:hypothetical protein
MAAGRTWPGAVHVGRATLRSACASSVSLEATDRWATWTRLALAGVAVALIMALIGLPPVDLHGPLHQLGIMDPLCGATRAVRLAAMGDWSKSWRYNPVGVPLVVGGVGLVLRAVVGSLTGRWVQIHVRLTPVWRRARWLVMAGLIVALEVDQQLHVTLLLSRH